MTDTPKAMQVRITGRVQGVGFRDWTRREAMRIGLTGWVRNEHDGSVTALLVGNDSAVTSILDRLHQGPPLSHVTGVTSETVSLTEMPTDFRITR